jgi:hypothetical protein
MMEALKEALHAVPGATAAIDALPAASVLARWVWLNGLLDARNEDYRRALPAVLKAVTEFIKQVLAAHPLYQRRR